VILLEDVGDQPSYLEVVLRLRRDTKERIAKAGLKTLLVRGFNGVAVQEITEQAGVPKGSFYSHFESKEALVVEIIERYEMDSKRRALLLDKAVHPVDRLRTHFEKLNASFIKSKFRRGCLLGNFSAELANQSEMIRNSLVKFFDCWTKDIEAAIEDAQARGAISSDRSAHDIAAFLLDAYEGAVLRARVERSQVPFDRFMKLTFEHILTCSQP
jgi:TetR/AcrR family transcriptional regulator, transcriptional repressor for nem operon